MRTAGDNPGSSSEGVFVAQPGRVAALLDLGMSGEGDAPSPLTDEGPPEVPGYQIIGRLGEGGMGTVWRAVQLGTGRSVALKLMRGAFTASARVRARFDREVQITAKLDHPNVARVFDSGVHRGAYYYAMELVEPALPLDEYAVEKAMSHKQVLGVMLRVCLAVAHAHENGVIHRDLKPANILIGNDGQPKVVDFGLARAVAEGGAELTVSGEGDLAGTPAYMSPEQAAGGGRLDTRSDVYSLGVILYRLLTHRSPHDLSGTRIDLLKRISERDVAVHRAARLGRELEAVLLKALARDRERRYATAAGLAADLERLINGEPIAARTPTLAYLAAKRVRKHWAVVVLAAVTAAMLSGMALFSYVRVLEQRRVAEQERSIAEEKTRQTQIALARSLTAEADAMVAARRWGEAREPYGKAIGILSTLGMLSLAPELGLVDALLRGPSAVLTVEIPEWVTAVAVTPDGKTALSGGETGALAAWELPTGRKRWEAKTTGGVRQMAVTPDGTTAIIAADDGVHLWDVRSGRSVGRLGSAVASRWAAAVSPDGRTVLTGTHRGELTLWDLEARSALTTVKGHDGIVRRVMFLPDGKHVVTASYDGIAAVRDARTLNIIAHMEHPTSISALAVSPDGRRIITGCWDKSMRMWDATTGVELHQFHGHDGAVEQVAFSPDGRIVATACSDAHVRLWDVEQRKLSATLCGHAQAVFDVAFTPDGLGLVSGANDSTLRLWNARPSANSATLGPTSPVEEVVLSADGRLVLSGHADGVMRLWDLPSHRLLREFRSGDVPPARLDWGLPVMSVGLSPDAKLALSATGDGVTRVWELASGRELRRLTGHDGAVFSVAFSPDGRQALTGGADGTARIWDVETGEQLRWFLPAVGEWCTGARFLPHSRRVVTAGESIHLSESGGAQIDLEAMTRYSGVAVSADGRVVAGGDVDPRRLKAWDARTGREICEVPGSFDHVRSVALSADGRLLASGARDGVVRVWDLASGREFRSFAVHDSGVESVDISRDARIVVCGDAAGIIHVWNSARLSAYVALEFGVARAMQAPAGADSEATANAALGHWYAERGMWRWAGDLLGSADATGTHVPALTMARCHWNNGDSSRAAEHFRRALDDASAEDRRYLELCLRVAEEEARSDSTPLGK